MTFFDLGIGVFYIYIFGVTCPIWLSLLLLLVFCHQVVHLFHLVFRQSRDSNPRPRTMACIAAFTTRPGGFPRYWCCMHVYVCQFPIQKHFRANCSESSLCHEDIIKRCITVRAVFHCYVTFECTSSWKGTWKEVYKCNRTLTPPLFLLTKVSIMLII